MGAWLETLRTRIMRLGHAVNGRWQQRMARAVATIERTSSIATLPTALAHGDFAPWNIRVEPHTGNLALFDWEDSNPNQALLWDAFHFQTQLALLVHHWSAQKSMQWVLATISRSPLVGALKLLPEHVRALYLSYLVDWSVQWLEDQQSPTDQETRGQIIDAMLQLMNGEHDGVWNALQVQ